MSEPKADYNQAAAAENSYQKWIHDLANSGIDLTGMPPRLWYIAGFLAGRKDAQSSADKGDITAAE